MPKPAASRTTPATTPASQRDGRRPRGEPASGEDVPQAGTVGWPPPPSLRPGSAGPGWVQEGPWAALGWVQVGVGSGVGGWGRVLSAAAGGWPQDEGDSPQEGGQVSSDAEGRGSEPEAPAGWAGAAPSPGSGWVWDSESGERDGSRPSRMDIGRLLRSNMASLVVHRG
jgi:hypothetical protein